jgi:hypothetical protein
MQVKRHFDPGLIMMLTCADYSVKVLDIINDLKTESQGDPRIA